MRGVRGDRQAICLWHVGWGVAITLLVWLALIGDASALLVPGSTGREVSFSGMGCGAEDAATLPLPSGARSIEMQSPEVGDAILDSDESDEVAIVRGFSLVAGGPTGRRARVVVSGARDACSEPSDTGWTTEEVPFRVSFREPVSVWADFGCDGPRVRPRQIVLTCADAGLIFQRIRYSRWGGSVATASGTVRYNDCDPFCAGGRIHYVPGTARMTAPHYCPNTGHWQYRRMILHSRAFKNRHHRYRVTVGCHTIGTARFSERPKAVAASSRYRAFVSCGSLARPRHSCSGGDLPYAFIRDRTYYRLCVTRPSGSRRCRLRQTPARIHYSRVPIPSDQVGSYRVEWVRHGRVLRTWPYRLHPEFEG